MAQVVADMREPRALRLQLRHQRQRLLHIRMHRMRHVAQRVQDEIIQPGQQFLRFFRHAAEIGEVCGLAEAESQHRLRPVQRRHRHEFHAKHFERSVNRVQTNRRQQIAGRRPVENVGKLPLQRGQRFRRTVHRDLALLPHVEGAYIVQSQNVVGVPVRVDHRVEPVDVRAHGLVTEIRRRVDHHVAPAVRKQNRRTHSLVQRIGRFAHHAVAPERRHPHRGAGTKHCQLQ